MDNSSNEYFDIGNLIKIIAVIKCAIEIFISVKLTRTFYYLGTYVRYSIGDYNHDPTGDEVITLLILCTFFISWNALVYGFGELISRTIDSNEKIAKILDETKANKKVNELQIVPTIRMCKNCETILSPGQRFCNNCGREID